MCLQAEPRSVTPEASVAFLLYSVNIVESLTFTKLSLGKMHGVGFLRSPQEAFRESSRPELFSAQLRNYCIFVVVLTCTDEPQDPVGEIASV